MSEIRGVSNILWSGGWDSTFRLLQLLIRQKRIVQPHYLIDADRTSTGAELRAMREIKRSIFTKYPETKSLLCPTMIMEVSDLAENARISDSYRNVLQTYNHIGSQYDWLARYCAKAGLEDIELGLTLDGAPRKFLEPFITFENEGGQRVYRVDRKYRDTDEYLLFGRYRFPLFDFSKKEMETLAREAGWLDVMKMTWFCHQPRRNYQACGICSPCSFTIQEGLGWRIPWRGRLRYYTSPGALIKRSNKMYAVVKSAKRMLRGEQQA